MAAGATSIRKHTTGCGKFEGGYFFLCDAVCAGYNINIQQHYAALCGFARLLAQGETLSMKLLHWFPSLAFTRHLPKELLSERAGAVMVEYVVLIGVVGIVLASTVAAFGPPIFESYRIARYMLLLPAP